MKSQKMIYIDNDLREKLRQEPNASKLIEDLLWEHYKYAAQGKKKSDVEENGGA